jgi:hypothetical protein
LPRSLCTLHGAMVVVSRPPSLRNSWALCSAVTSGASSVTLLPSDFHLTFIRLSFNNFHLTIFVQWLPSTNFRPQRSIHRRLSIVVHIWYYIFQTIFSALYCYKNFGAWENIMSSDDENTTIQPKPRY